MKLNQIEAIVAIAEAGSLRGAAGAIGRTQPALTKALRQAEDELGARIFLRTGRGVEPTPEGQAIIARSRVIHSEMRKLDEEIRHGQGAITGQLHVTVSPLAAVRIVPWVIDRFRRQFPGVHVQVTSGHPPAALSLLRSGETDFAIGPAPDKADATRLTVTPLLKTELSVITGEGSRFATRRHLAELLEAEWIMVGPRTRTFGIAGDFRRAGLPAPQPLTTSDSITSLLAMIEGSDRVCSFPSLMLPEVLPRWRIATIPIEEPLEPVQIGLMTLADRPLTPSAQHFADLVVRRAAAIASDNLRE